MYERGWEIARVLNSTPRESPGFIRVEGQFAILCGFYVLDALSEYWERDEKTMWAAFLEDEYAEDDYK